MEKNTYLEMIHQLQFVKGQQPTKEFQQGDLVLFKGIVFIIMLDFVLFSNILHRKYFISDENS